MGIRIILLLFTVCLLPQGVFADGLLYIAPTYSYNSQQINLSGETWSYGGGDAGIINSDSGKVMVSPGKKYTHSIPGGNRIKNTAITTLALGVDLRSKLDLPLRFELAGTFPYTVDLSYDEVYGEYGSGNDTEIPLTENFGAQQFFQIQYYSIILNAYFDLHNSTPFTPYMGVGIGATHYSVKHSAEVSIEYKEAATTQDVNIGSLARPEKFENNPAGWLLSYNLTAGVAYKFTDSVILDLSYRYTGMEDIHLGPSASGPYSAKTPLVLETSGQTISSHNHRLTLGMRFIL